MNTRKQSNNRGFTLIEMMVAIGIIGILSAIAIPNYFAWQRDANLRRAVSDLTSDLAMARLHAIKGSNSVRVSFATVGAHDYEVVVNVDETVIRRRAYPPGVTGDYQGTILFHPTSNAEGDTVRLTNANGNWREVFVNPVGSVLLNPP